MKKVTFYHAGCPVCVAAEQQILNVLDKSSCELDVVHFGAGGQSRIAEAEALGVKSVPALVIGGEVLHINFGASLEDVKKILSA